MLKIVMHDGKILEFPETAETYLILKKMVFEEADINMWFEITTPDNAKFLIQTSFIAYMEWRENND